jgi:hypothetical protein
MGKFSELDLKWYEEEDLEDLDDEYHISGKTTEELNKLATKLYWEAQGLVDQANRLESKADAIRRYLDLIEK